MNSVEEKPPPTEAASPQSEEAVSPQNKTDAPSGGEKNSPGRSADSSRGDEETLEKLDPTIPILLAERSPLQLPRFKRLLADFQLENVTITGNGYRAVKLGREKKFELILIGHSLNDVDGINVIEALRADGENTETPIVFMWEGVEKTLIDRAISVKANGTLQKPVEETYFRRIFETHLGKYIVSVDDERERAHEAMKPMIQAADFAKNIRSQGDYEAAENAFKAGLIELFCGLAEVYLSMGNPSYANRVMAQAEKIDPRARTRFGLREETFIERGKKYLGKKWHDGAKVEFEAALSLNKNSIPALAGLGEALMGTGDSAGATEAFERGIEAKVMHEDRSTFNHFGTVALRNKDFGIAIRAFDKAIKYFPQNPVTYYNKSLLYVLQKQWDKVTPLLKKSLSIDPGFAEARVMMAKVEKWKKA